MNDFDKIIKFFSKQRMEFYVKNFGNNNESVIEAYECNVLLSSQLYIYLQYFEVIFRNFCNEEIIRIYKDEQWYSNRKILLDNTDKFVEKQINSAKDRIKKPNNVQQTCFKNCDIISNMDLGFWVYIFAGINENKIWQPCFRDTFNKHNLKRNRIWHTLDDIRFIRNKIAHHGCIIKYDYEKYYNNISSILNCIAPSIMDRLEHISNFKTIDNQLQLLKQI